jgi:hypothetical protein
VRSRACAAIGRWRAGEAIPALRPLLEDPEAGGTCGAALAAIGTEPAYRALEAAVRGALAGGSLSAHLVTALASFLTRPFVAEDAAAALLSEIMSNEELGWVTRRRAAAALGITPPERGGRRPGVTRGDR